MGCFERIARDAKFYLKRDGIILLEIGFGQFHSVRKIFDRRGYKFFLKEKDLQGIIRVVGFKVKKNFESLSQSANFQHLKY